MPLEMRETPYSKDEERVSDYIQEITQGMIGSGDDPIGFLIACHRNLNMIVKTLMPLGTVQAITLEADSLPPKA